VCVAVALQEFEHKALVEVSVLVIAEVGCVMLIVFVAVQLLASVAITVYIPGHKLDTVEVIDPVNTPVIGGQL
jgi:hypothetical protein